MHRTFSLPRRLGWWSLLVALTFAAGLQTASAQVQPALPVGGQTGAPNASVIELAVGASRTWQMATRADLKRVENPNSNVVRVERVAGKNDEILLVAEKPGRTLITFTDQKDRLEIYEVIVAAAAAPAPPLEVVPAAHLAQQQQPGPEAQQMSIVKGSLKSLRLKDAPIGGIVNENSKVVKVTQSKDELTVITFEALEVGRTRVIFFYDKERTRADVFEVNVVGPDIKGVHQVQLEVVVAVVNRSQARNLSFSFMNANNNWFISSLIGGSGTFAQTFTQGPISTSLTGNPNIPFGVLNSVGGTVGFIQALRTEGVTKILAEPRLVTLSGRPAVIQSGGNVQIVAAGGVSSAQISADFGTIVKFLPIVLPNGMIHLEVSPEVSTPTNTIPIPGAGNAGTVSFSVLKRAAQVTVRMEDGQTLAIGGLIQNRVDSTATKVPVLGDVPFFGAAFRSMSYTEVEEEMIILVTPRLVHPVDCGKIPKYLPGRETRNPDDFELFLEGILEAPKGQRNVVFHPHLYKPAFHNAVNAGQIPCNDGSCGARPGCASGNCAASDRVTGLFAPSSATPLPSANVPGVAMPTTAPTFPTVPATPTSNSRITVEPEQPGSIPPVRDNAPGLGPVTPTLPSIPLPRQQVPSPVLPPLSVPASGR